MTDIAALKNGISRRSLLKSAPLVATTAVSLEVMAGKATAQQTKIPQRLAKYQDKPQSDGADCANCLKFVAPASCQVVIGCFAVPSSFPVRSKTPARVEEVPTSTPI